VDGSLAEQTVFSGPTTQVVNGTELAIFAQDRWRIGPRLTFELGLRTDRDAIVERFNWSPRAGVAIGVLPEGRAILRGGFGKFSQRTPLNIGAFPSFETRLTTRFATNGTALMPPVSFAHVIDGELTTPEAIVGNVEWDQRFGRRFLLKVNYLRRHGSHEYILDPDPAAGTIDLASAGTSRYWELETSVRYLGGERRDFTVSYVRSHGTADLNNYDQFFGNLRNPIIRTNENNLIPTDVPHRLLVRGTMGLPTKLVFAPVLEVRSGFPWSAVDEFLDFVGPRSRAGRLPTVTTLDFQLWRNWRFKKYRFRAGIKMYNVFGASAERDVQNNLTSPNYGSFFNPIERSIGFVIGSAR
jgi:outer membrane receptor protein involved in Fe transport